MKPSPSISYSWNAPNEPTYPLRGILHPHRHKERTFELLVQSTTTCDTESTNELLKIDRPVLVLIEHIEDIIRKLTRISEREELLVDPAEFCLVELA